MKDRIIKLLKTKIGTSFVEDPTKNLLILRGYGRNVLIQYESVIQDKSFTRIMYPSENIFTTVIDESNETFDKQFVASIKMMINLLKEEGK
jgi:hypothetical protein